MYPLTTFTGNTDVYLLDQIMKGRYAASDTILDAGAGGGRNMYWFEQQGIQIFGTDRNPEAEAALRQHYPDLPDDRFQVAAVESLPFPEDSFDHVICSAVLHFAENQVHFEQMFGELIRVLRPGGSLFIRTATDVGLADKMIPLGDGRFWLPDESERYLLTRPLLDTLIAQHKLIWLEPFKTVLVEDVRSMAVVVLGKT
jgi:tellurite methyltransferase